MDRMGINYGRLFVYTLIKSLRDTRGSVFGRALDGTFVNNIGAYRAAVTQLRSPAGAQCPRTYFYPPMDVRGLPTKPPT